MHLGHDVHLDTMEWQVLRSSSDVMLSFQKGSGTYFRRVHRTIDQTIQPFQRFDDRSDEDIETL